MSAISRLAAAIALSGGVSLAGVGLATAHADPAWGPSYQGGNCPPGITCTHWCPGDPLYSWSNMVAWDWNVCHDWYWNSEGTVDVATNLVYPWNGVPHEAAPPPPLPAGPPPPLPPRPAHCPPWNVIIGPSECGGL
jgi:hypothetical protein